MRGIILKTGKRRGTIPRWKIRAAVKALFLREAQEAEIKNQAANTGKVKHTVKAR
ncbi:hypothetical protein [Chitinophaga sp. YIM B06452]|uniref:hypothetical protein n=1 Tax=Chitinophaga sp. YIM B06452 TaxID=3082158 RepID=UPI0031FEAEEC